MADITPPTGKEIRDSWMEDSVLLDIEDEYTTKDDHGYGWTRVFRRRSDRTYWQVCGVSQNEGMYDTLRDDYEYIEVKRVYPYNKIVRAYAKEPPNNYQETDVNFCSTR